VTIELGYVDQLQPMFRGEVTGLTPNFPEGGTPVLTVNGHNRLHRLDGSRQTRSFQDVTDKEIVDTIAGQVGLTPRADPTSVKYRYVTQCNQTNLEFLRGRAQELHFELLVDDHTLIFRKSQASAPKVVSLKWGETLRSGHLVRLDDSDGKEKIEIIDKSGKNKLVIDTAANTVTISADADIVIKSANGKIALSGKSVEITSTSSAQISARTVSVQADGDLILKGQTVNIN
jgi:hypothetical protein